MTNAPGEGRTAGALQRGEAEARLHPCLALLHNTLNNIIDFKVWKTDNMIFVILLYLPVIHFWLPLNSLDRYLYAFIY